MTTAGDAATRKTPKRIDAELLKADFPILDEMIHGKPLSYLDNAATTQKPQCVLDAMTYFYSTEYSNVHRGLHELSSRATAAYETARETVGDFLNARATEEIVFVRGTTEAINLVAQSYGGRHVGAGDEVVISAMEHHSDIVPWQLLCEAKGARLKVAPIDDAGDIRLDALEAMLGPRTRIVAVTHVSNALGTCNPVRQIGEMAHARGIPVLLDGAQAAPRMPVDVQALDCDFYAFSGHKIYGPSGIGVLYGKRERLESMPPYQGGGEMIRQVTFEETTYNDPPFRFEAGTPNITGAVGLAVALDYIGALSLESIEAHEGALLEALTDRLGALPGVRIIGTAKERAGLVSFVVEGIHPHDVGTILDHEGVAVRAGHHCAQPTMERYSVPATVRASLGLYNTEEDIEALIRGMDKVREVFL
jgi:cysteine desulfurase/selenocysteine lyase